MAELIYAKLTQSRKSTRLPHTHKFTSLKNVIISALHEIDKRIHIQAEMQLSKEEYARKEHKTILWCKLKVPSLRITVRHHSPSLAMLNSYHRDRIFNPQLTAIKNSYNKINVQCSNICYTRIWDMFCPYVTYENVIWPNVSYTQKKIYKCVCTFFFFTYEDV